MGNCHRLKLLSKRKKILSMSSETVNNATETETPKGRANMHNARYGEVLLVTGHLTHLEASVYNTIGLNDCPAADWEALNANAIKKEFKAHAAILNGPRYFMMDKVSSSYVGETFTFGNLAMRKFATVRIPLGNLLGGFKQKPYTERIIDRTTIYIYSAGSTVYELIAPNGKAYVMQSYSLQVDPQLTEADLANLGSRLQLPENWQYRSRELDADFLVQAHGEAHLVQDDFLNSYQRVDN